MVEETLCVVLGRNARDLREKISLDELPPELLGGERLTWDGLINTKDGTDVHIGGLVKTAEVGEDDGREGHVVKSARVGILVHLVIVPGAQGAFEVRVAVGVVDVVLHHVEVRGCESVHDRDVEKPRLASPEIVDDDQVARVKDDGAGVLPQRVEVGHWVVRCEVGINAAVDVDFAGSAGERRAHIVMAEGHNTIT